MTILIGAMPGTPPEGGGRVRGLRGPALLRRRPRAAYRPASAPIVPPEAYERYPELREDLGFLAEVLEPEFSRCDVEALREQNRYRRQQLVLLIAGAAGATLGALQAALADTVWPGVALTLTSTLSGVFAQAVERGGALRRYIDQRTRAERLRSLYFQYVARIDRYAGDERRGRLRMDVEDVLTRDLA